MHDIEKFLRFFGNDHVLAYLSLDSNKVIPGCGVVFGTTETLLPELLTLTNATAHIVVNETDGLGRRYENITKPRIYFADFDRECEKEEIKELMLNYTPHMVVQTSAPPNTDRGKYHFYWKCSTNTEWRAWEQVQRGINKLLDARDPSTWVRTHTLRIPGISRICKDGSTYLPRIVWCDPNVSSGMGIDEEEVFGDIIWDVGAQEEQIAKTRESEITSHLIDHLQADREFDFTLINKGERNSSLYAIGKRMVTLPIVKNQDELKIKIEAINKKLPLEIGGALDADEISDIVKSAWQRGLKVLFKQREEKAKLLGEIVDESTEPFNDAETPSLKPSPRLSLEFKNEYQYGLQGIHSEERFSSRAIVERFLIRFGAFLVRVEDKGVYCFDDLTGVWVKQDKGDYAETKRYFDMILDEMVLSYEFCQMYGTTNGGEPDRRKLEKERERVCTVKNMSSYVASLFNSSSIATMKAGDFDSNPEIFHCGSGVLHLIDGSVRPVKATDYLLMKSDLTWDETAVAPRWEQFLREIFAKNDEPDKMIECLQEIFGYSLSGEMTVQAVYCHVGSGANGKSTVLRVLRRLCSEYARKLGPDILSGKSDAKFERVAQRLRGLRCAIIDDIETTLSINEAFIKNMTDTEIEARALFAEHTAIKNRAKVHMGVNELPKPESNSDGFFRRIRILSYNQKFVNDPVKSGEIEDMITEEIQGILTWAVKGYRRFKAQGKMTTPTEILLDAQEYREQTSVSNRFLEQIFEVATSGRCILCKDALNIAIEHCEKFQIDMKLTPVRLGIAIKEVFGLRSEVVWQEGASIRVYRLMSKVHEDLM